jgi:hypothetical protein
MGNLNESDLRPKIVEALEGAGFETLEDAQAADDADLLAISGIGPAAVEQIRTAVMVEDPEDPEDPVEPSDAEDLDADDDDDTPADDGDGGEAAGGDVEPVARPTPKPQPQPSKDAPAPPGCQWIRLRKGADQLVTSAHLSRTGETVKVLLLGGVRYPMPVGVHIGAVDRWHPMVVLDEPQHDYPAIKLSEIDNRRWTIDRQGVAHFLAAAQSVIEKHSGAAVAKECVEKGTEHVMARYNALRAVHPEIPEAHAHIVPTELPELCVAISQEEMDGLQAADELSDPESGKSFATKRDLIAYQAAEARRRQIPDEMKRMLDERISGILRMPATEGV